jgi:hypothetical protein
MIFTLMVCRVEVEGSTHSSTCSAVLYLHFWGSVPGRVLCSFGSGMFLGIYTFTEVGAYSSLSRLAVPERALW